MLCKYVFIKDYDVDRNKKNTNSFIFINVQKITNVLKRERNMSNLVSYCKNLLT